LAERVLAAASELDDRFEIANAKLVQARVALARGHAARVAAQLATPDSGLPQTLEGEWVALRSVALAASGVNDAAVSSATAALYLTREIQAQTLARLALAINALVQESPDLVSQLDAAEQALLATQNYDSLVCACRAYPGLLPALVKRSRLPPDRLRVLLTESHDWSLLESVGWTRNVGEGVYAKLSPREREVLGFLAEGLTNREIAGRLVISEVTVKVHVRHILEKLGVRSRTEAALLVQATA
jgi:DNA-binding NarL/FixJ family response regulator